MSWAQGGLGGKAEARRSDLCWCLGRRRLLQDPQTPQHVVQPNLEFVGVDDGMRAILSMRVSKDLCGLDLRC